jgi:predicted O-methyltransferase YrrM
MILLQQILHPILPDRVRNLPGFKEGLLDLINDLPDNIIVAEVGCYAGESTVAWAIKAKQLFAIDPWGNNYDKNDTSSEEVPMVQIYAEFLQRIEPYKNKVCVIHETSTEAVKRFLNESIDVVYIDACHKYESVKEDIFAWYPKVKIGGFICGHDYSDFWHEVRDAVNECIVKPDKIYQDTSWMKIKK